jgi:methyl coenzyme M reductase gamma subunit
MELDFNNFKSENEDSITDTLTITDEDLAAILSAEHSFHIDEGIDFENQHPPIEFMGMHPISHQLSHN